MNDVKLLNLLNDVSTDLSRDIIYRIKYNNIKNLDYKINLLYFTWNNNNNNNKLF